jgi:hypothetical protein
MVQVAGSREWRPIKEVIAEVRVAEKYAAKKRREAGNEKRPAKKRGGRDALPLIPPPPKNEPETQPLEAPAREEPPSGAGAGEPPGALPQGSAPRSPPARTSAREPAPPPSPRPQEPPGAEEFPNAFIDDPHPQGAPEEPASAAAAAEATPPPIGAADEPPVIPPGDESIRIAVPDEPVGLATGEKPPAILPESEPPSIEPPESVDPGEEPLAALPDAAPPGASPEEPVGVADEEPPAILPEGPAPVPDVDAGEAPSPTSETEGFGGAFIDPATSSGIEDLVEVPDEPPVIAPEVEPPVIFPSESLAEEAVSPAPSAPAPRDEPPVAPTAPPAASRGEDRPATTPPSRVRVVVRDPMARSVEARPTEPLAAPPDTSPSEPPPHLPSPEDESPEPLVSPEPPPEEPPPVFEEDVGSLPVIPLKPNDSLPPAAATEAPPPAARPRTRPPAPRPVAEEEPVFAAPAKRGPLVEALLAAVAAIGAFLSRALSPINRLERGDPVTSGETPAAVRPALQDLRTKASTLAGTVGHSVGELVGRARDSLARKDSSTRETSAQPPLPLVPPPPGPRTTDEEAPSRLAVMLQNLTATVSSWIGALQEWVGRLPSALPFPSKKEDPELPPIGAPELPQAPPLRSVEPLASTIEPDPPEVSGSDDMVPVSLKKPTWRTESPAPAPTPPPPEVPEPPVRVRPPREEAPRASVPAPSPKPPPPVTELPSIPLAPQRHQPRKEVGDVYEGPGMGDVLHAAWAWTKVLLVLAAVGAIVAFAVLNWRTWFPRATELGRQAFIEVDKVARSGEFRKAVDDAAAQVPQLSPETIRQVQDASPSGLLEPVEVFRVASEAAQRGESGLTAEESSQLQALRGELLSGLSPADRERLREYEDIRARREPFPVENASALPLYARAARSLPPERLESLQALLAKAVAAGLETPNAGE